MRAVPGRLSRPGLALWMLCGFAAPAPAAPLDGHDLPPSTGVAPASAVVDPLLDFDIPAQALDAALQRYGSLSHQPALYRAEIVNGQMASAVHGRYTAEQALQLLLQGTGLTAEKFATGRDSAFILKAAPASSRQAGLGSLAGYPARLQTRVWQALCDNPRTAPGSYRSLLRFQVDAAGRIARARMLGSTGDAARDAAMLETLQHVRMDSAPPRGMAQPVTLLLLPTDAGFGRRCDQEIAGGRPHHE